MIQQFHSYICIQKNWKEGLKQILYTKVHDIILVATRKKYTGPQCAPRDEGMGKTYNWILSSHKKEWSADTCYSTKPWKYVGSVK